MSSKASRFRSKRSRLPALVIISGIVASSDFARLFGTAIAVTTMLRSCRSGASRSDAFRPVTDNAGGVAEMQAFPGGVPAHDSALDAVGNTSKGVTKGYAIGSARLGAFVLSMLIVAVSASPRTPISFPISREWARCPSTYRTPMSWQG